MPIFEISADIIATYLNIAIHFSRLANAQADAGEYENAIISDEKANLYLTEALTMLKKFIV